MNAIIPYVFAVIGILMLGHLFLIYVDLSACYWLIKLRVDEVGAVAANLADTGCRNVETTYQQAVDKYLAIALALAGGGTAGVVLKDRRKDGD